VQVARGSPRPLWVWLEGVALAAERLRERLGDHEHKLPVVVVRRNRRRPLVVLDLEDFEGLLADGIGGWCE
jgi:hypothetical protein